MTAIGSFSQAPPPPDCPECGRPMKLRTTTRFKYANGLPRLFYGCTGFPECKGTHGAHPDGRPLGIPGDKETKAARHRAHETFDKVWRGGRLSRKAAYRRMQILMNMTNEEAHIGRFTIEQCEELIRLLKDPKKWMPSTKKQRGARPAWMDDATEDEIQPW